MRRRRILSTELTVEDLQNRSLSVKYEANGITDWEIFFDGEQVCLITAGYVPSNLLDWRGYSIEKGRGEYSVRSIENREELLAWLKDPVKWEAFASGIAGAIAVGAPSLEQFLRCFDVMKSYQNQKLKFEKNTYCGWFRLEEPSELFIPHRFVWKWCCGYWLASPNSSNSNYVWYVSDNAYVYSYSYRHTNRGVRPLVFLPFEIVLEYDKNLEMWLLV